MAACTGGSCFGGGELATVPWLCGFVTVYGDLIHSTFPLWTTAKSDEHNRQLGTELCWKQQPQPPPSHWSVWYSSARRKGCSQCQVCVCVCVCVCVGVGVCVVWVVGVVSVCIWIYVYVYLCVCAGV